MRKKSTHIPEGDTYRVHHKSISVGSWSSAPLLPVTEVHILIEGEQYNLAIAIKSREAANALIAALQENADAVFGKGL